MLGKSQFTVDTSALYLQSNKKKSIQLENYIHIKVSKYTNLFF